MRPILFHLFDNVFLYSYGVCMSAGIFCGFLLFFSQVKDKFETPIKILFLFIVVVIFGFGGAVIFFYFFNYQNESVMIFKNIAVGNISFELPVPLAWGLVYYGAIAGGVLAGLIYSAIFSIDIRDILDYASPSIAIGHGWGRLGCFMAGCCYGRICNPVHWYCVSFPSDSVAYLEIGAGARAVQGKTPFLYPTQVVESVGELMIAFLLWQTIKFRRFKGMVFSFYLIFYGLLRFFVEFLRVSDRVFAGVVSPNQIVSLAGIVLGVCILIAALMRN